MTGQRARPSRRVVAGELHGRGAVWLHPHPHLRRHGPHRRLAREAVRLYSYGSPEGRIGYIVMARPRGGSVDRRSMPMANAED